MGSEMCIRDRCLGCVWVIGNTYVPEYVRLPWWIVLLTITGSSAVFGVIVGAGIKALALFNKVYIPVSIQQYHRNDKPWPTERGEINAPRLSWIGGPTTHNFYFGPRGGSILTATHIRVINEDPEVDIGNHPGTTTVSYTHLTLPTILRV